MNFLRKLRGLLGIGVTWGLSWAAVGAGIGLAVAIFSPTVGNFANPILGWALGIGAYGFVSGIGFGAVLSLKEGRKTIMDLSLGRSVIWGILGGLAVPLLFGALGAFEAGTTVVDVLQAIALTGALGGVFGPGTIALARRAELTAGDSPTLLDSGTE